MEQNGEDLPPGQFGNDYAARSNGRPEDNKLPDERGKRPQITGSVGSGQSSESRLAKRDHGHVSYRNHESERGENAYVPVPKGMIDKKVRNAGIQAVKENHDSQRQAEPRQLALHLQAKARCQLFASRETRGLPV